jgi:hypothetical protein
MILVPAKEAIDALKGTPFLLVILILNIVMLAGFTWTLHEVSNAQERRESILKACIDRST